MSALHVLQEEYLKWKFPSRWQEFSKLASTSMPNLERIFTSSKKERDSENEADKMYAVLVAGMVCCPQLDGMHRMVMATEKLAKSLQDPVGDPKVMTAKYDEARVVWVQETHALMEESKRCLDQIVVHDIAEATGRPALNLEEHVECNGLEGTDLLECFFQQNCKSDFAAFKQCMVKEGSSKQECMESSQYVDCAVDVMVSIEILNLVPVVPSMEDLERLSGQAHSSGGIVKEHA